MDPLLWKYKSDFVKDLISKMLELNIEKRISAQDILKHEWFLHENIDGHLEATDSNDFFVKNFSKLHD